MNRSLREFLIDGYNLLHALKLNQNDLTLEQQREQLETRLLEVQNVSRQRITVVYDGQGRQSPRTEQGAITRVFTPSRITADDWIMDYIGSRGGNAGLFTVVSSDRMITSHAKAYGAARMTSQRFIDRWLSGRTPALNASRTATDGRLSDREVSAWLQIFEGKP
ncbi:NYN domain-containing protein [Prosthecochloris sp. N3]|uniref:NYN domain-containing protein n=1 Tax=Prosthecochloris ethylica TaxID=2743976 RepID=A0ABR9XRF9_9CHLB|nr:MULTISPECIES: NYN domain-containing protein [Prosthecochloris]MBF0586091.1 NYN domain-containing protein [Prosthecochloris ethylica]MBF0636509.1 NYN domain-containing protein [Prosthecochloris ethylica]NUK47141.1 NYN domain-containing protein [Prosthecochloris ethylica]RNA65685.1 hypothetical protein CR163_010975 [Prosthecochloris sp. ZM_2]